MTPSENVLPKLECVRTFGNSNRGIARCPAHEDKSPSLSWRVCDDGTVLVKCWAGCSAHDIVDAMGLKLRDLFVNHHVDRPRLDEPNIDYREALAVLRRESTVVMLAADHIANGVCLGEEDVGCVLTAARRIRDVAESARWRT